MSEQVRTNPFFVEFRRRTAHMESLPGTEIKNSFESLNTSYYIVDANAKEFVGLVGSFTGTSVHVDHLPRQFPDEFSRQLHNFLAAAKSLMEVQRSIANHFWGKTSGFVIQLALNKRAEIFDTGEVQFLFKLRDLSLHRGSPKPELGTVISQVRGKPVIQENQIQFKRDELLQWQGWTTASKAFLAKQNELFEISAVIERYREATNQYFLWFWKQFEADFAAAIQEHKDKVMELTLWHEDVVGAPDWFMAGGDRPDDWSARRSRAEKTLARYAFGSRGYRTIAVDGTGGAEAGESDGWGPLPKR